MIKLVATDMDGTFLDEAGQFDMERLKALLSSYKERGIYFAVASGRGLLSLEKHFADVKDEIIFIAENGSLVRFHGQDLYEATMSRDFYLSTFEKLKTSPYFDEKKMLLTGKEACYVLDTVDETYLMFSHHYNENIKKVARLEDITDEIFKFTTNFTEETVEAGEAWVNEHVPGVKAMTTGFESIDIVLDHVDKGFAIVELAKKLNLDMDQVMAFGDNLNDLQKKLDAMNEATRSTTAIYSADRLYSDFCLDNLIKNKFILPNINSLNDGDLLAKKLDIKTMEKFKSREDFDKAVSKVLASRGLSNKLAGISESRNAVTSEIVIEVANYMYEKNFNLEECYTNISLLNRANTNLNLGLNFDSFGIAYGYFRELSFLSRIY